MKWRTLIIAGLGLALALYLVWYVGLGAILAAAVAVGWGGFALLCLGSVALFGLLGSAWHVLLPASSGAGAWIFVRARLVRDSASEVLPFSQLGGIAIGARRGVARAAHWRMDWQCARCLDGLSPDRLAHRTGIGRGHRESGRRGAQRRGPGAQCARRAGGRLHRAHPALRRRRRARARRVAAQKGARHRPRRAGAARLAGDRRPARTRGSRGRGIRRVSGLMRARSGERRANQLMRSGTANSTRIF